MSIDIKSLEYVIINSKKICLEWKSQMKAIFHKAFGLIPFEFENKEWYIIKKENNIICFTSYQIDKETYTLTLWDLCTDPIYQHQGIASHLLKYIKNQNLDLRLRVFILFGTLLSNSKIQKDPLYEKRLSFYIKRQFIKKQIIKMKQYITLEMYPGNQIIIRNMTLTNLGASNINTTSLFSSGDKALAGKFQFIF